ncbi:MAG: hypothetical protein A6D91_08405 [Bacillaceae bacterium G1]|mgnify:CR=1 FL=1|nr:hypothetical protein [Bacillota bacterium]OJF17330.1 MAG: hypothetical protein A6D91_08405 [Bacillaceae bacterium G1]
MPKRIAVESRLTPIRQHLQQNGYEVVDLDSEQITECDCCVISGSDENVMGMQDIEIDAPVINAHGLTPEEVQQHIEARVGR